MLFIFSLVILRVVYDTPDIQFLTISGQIAGQINLLHIVFNGLSVHSLMTSFGQTHKQSLKTRMRWSFHFYILTAYT